MTSVSDRVARCIANRVTRGCAVFGEDRERYAAWQAGAESVLGDVYVVTIRCTCGCEYQPGVSLWMPGTRWDEAIGTPEGEPVARYAEDGELDRSRRHLEAAIPQFRAWVERITCGRVVDMTLGAYWFGDEPTDWDLVYYARVTP